VTTSPMLEFPRLLAQVPAPPAPELDPYLDAAARCFARHGLFRTSVQDVANELGVNRTTVYRQVGNIDQLARLLAVRDIHRMLISLAPQVVGLTGPEVLVEVMETVVVQARSHPVLEKVLSDEPLVVQVKVFADFSDLLDRVASLVAPLLRAAMDAGFLAQRDPMIVSEWLVRTAVSLILTLPAGGVRPFLAEVLVPALAPGGGSG
jgi:AcrR family transcriptional regulator